MEIITTLINNSSEIATSVIFAIGALSAFLAALVKLFMLIPGEQPEKALQKVVDFIAKYSRK